VITVVAEYQIRVKLETNLVCRGDNLGSELFGEEPNIGANFWRDTAPNMT
jgi:hypothetical protein